MTKINEQLEDLNETTAGLIQVDKIVMPDDQPCQATDPKELEEQIMSASVAKNGLKNCKTL